MFSHFSLPLRSQEIKMETKTGMEIKLAAELLKAGKLVAIPTETVYGLAANGFDAAAIAGIFEAKGRPHFDPLILHIANMDQVGRLTTAFPENAKKLADRFWPGPLTLVLPKSDLVPDLATSGLDTVGIRMPNHPMTRELLQLIDFPLAAPSANPFGYISPTTAQHVKDQLNGKIDYILDGGNCDVGIESTIVGFADNRITILRQGGISKEEIEEIVGEVYSNQISSSAPLAPGMLLSHYAPRTPLIRGNIKTLAEKYASRKIAVLGFTSTSDYTGIALSENGDLNEAAQNLFSAMRTLDNSGFDLIIAEIFPERGLGLGINDRLKRAESKTEV